MAPKDIRGSLGGMAISSRARRGKLVDDVRLLLDLPDGEQIASPALVAGLEKWWKIQNDAEKCNTLQFELKDLAVHWHSRILGFDPRPRPGNPSKAGPGGPDSSPPDPRKP